MFFGPVNQKPEVINGVVNGLSVLITENQLVVDVLTIFFCFLLLPVLLEVLLFENGPIHPLEKFFCIASDWNLVEHSGSHKAECSRAAHRVPDLDFAFFYNFLLLILPFPIPFIQLPNHS